MGENEKQEKIKAKNNDEVKGISLGMSSPKMLFLIKILFGFVLRFDCFDSLVAVPFELQVFVFTIDD